MSRKRSISTDISTDPKLAAVAEEWGALPLLLYTWAIPHANDLGQIVENSTQFRLLVCPALPIKSSEVAVAIQQLVVAGLWRHDGEEGREYLQFPEEAWFRHQSYINANKRPKAAQTDVATEEQQETPRNSKKQQETAQNTVSPSPTPSPTPSLSEETETETDTPDGVAGDKRPALPAPKLKKMPLPTEPEVLAYFTEKGHPEFAEGFWDYWQSVGWRRKNQVMVDWQASVRTWITRQSDFAPARAAPPEPVKSRLYDPSHDPKYSQRSAA